MLAFGEGLCSYRPPVDLKTIADARNRLASGDTPHVVLNFITPHQKWASTPPIRTSPDADAEPRRSGGLVVRGRCPEGGNRRQRLIEVFNLNGALTARASCPMRMKDGTLFMYHAQEKIVNTPGSEITGKRGGIHNSVTRATLKPTHMIGGYAQQSYGFNYYGTVGSNRDEYVIVKKLGKVDWLDRPARGGASS